MTRPLLVIGACAALVATASQAQAQDRKGFWVSFGASAGSGECSQVRCSSTRKLGPAAYFGAGGTMSQQVLLGVEMDGWMNASPDTVRQYGIVTAVAQVYPSRSLPLYVKGGVGVGRYVEDPEAEALLSAAGFAYLLGAGIELPIGSSMSLTPFLHFVLAPNLRARLGRVTQLQGPLDYNLLHLGMGVHWP